MDLIQNEDYTVDSCAKSPMAFLFLLVLTGIGPPDPVLCMSKGKK